jgi:hypothetical protein
MGVTYVIFFTKYTIIRIDNFRYLSTITSDRFNNYTFVRNFSSFYEVTKNVFVLTDAAEWLQNERKKIVDKEWKIYSISSHGEKDRRHDSDEATLHGVEYHASLRVAQQCQAFVGHWGSGVTHQVYQAMCFQHHTYLGQCPPTFDMR